MNPYQILELILEALADGRQKGESIKDFKKRKANELEKHFRDQAHLYRQGEAIAAQRAKEAKIRYEENPNSETGQQMVDSAINALDKAQKTTKVERKEYNARRIKNKMSNEALEIMEEIINEVSTKLWKKAAANSLDKREETAKNTAKTAEQSWDDYEEGSRKSPEDEPALYRRAWKNDLSAKKAEDRGEHAHDVLAVKSNAKSANKAIKAAKKVVDKREDAFGANPNAKTLNRSNKASNLVYADPKYKNEALSLMEQICDFADNLFELDYEEKQNISPNKISRTKKDKDGEKVEVVSVADELFPYSGSAKEQFNKKVLAKINDMIEGTGSLEDLIQFVRAGVKNKAHESIQEEKKEPNAECEYRKGEWDKAVQNYYDTKKKNMDFEGKHPETKKAYDEERKAYANLDKARRDSKKINGPYEALEEIKNVAEGLFKKDERGDLLDDIDTALGSPVKKKLADIKAKMTGCKETKVHEALELIEEIVNEVSDRVYRIGKNKASDIGNAQEEAAKTAEGEDKEWAKDQAAKRSHQAAVLDDKYERQVVKRAEEEYRKSKVDRSSKK